MRAVPAGTVEPMKARPIRRWLVPGLAVVVAGLLALPWLLDRERLPLDDAARRQAPGQMLVLPRGHVHVELGGPVDGPPVVLVHGFSVPSYVWDPTFAALAAAGHRVLRYDLYGRGWSDRPALVYDRALFVSQLREVLDGVGLHGPVDLVGLSMGGAIAAAFAAEHPQRVRRIAFIAPFNRARDIAPLDRPLLGEYLNRVYLLPRLAALQASDFAEPERFAGWTERFRAQMRHPGFGAAILSTLRHFVSVDPLPDYRRVGALGRPALLLWGERDGVLPFAEHRRVLDALGGAAFVAVPDAGHLPQLEQPEAVQAALLDFLGRR